MFGLSKKTEVLEQSNRSCLAALQRIAKHVGVTEHQLPPDQLATEICNSIDSLVGKASPKEAIPGSESRSIAANISKIKLSGAVDVVVQQGLEPKMEVFTNDATDLPKILTKISGDCLTVDSEPMMIISGARGITQIINGYGNSQVTGQNFTSVHGFGNVVERYSGQSGLRVEVTLPNVTNLRISGAGNVTYRDIDQDELSLDVSGAGTIKVHGKVNRLEADVSGAGNIAAYQLSAVHGRLRVSGAGGIKAVATMSVVARVSGAGTIKISGNPPQRDTDVSGVGKIKFVDSHY